MNGAFILGACIGTPVGIVVGAYLQHVTTRCPTAYRFETDDGSITVHSDDTVTEERTSRE